MDTTTVDLTIPAFLDRRGQKSRMPRAPRWSRLPTPERPEGERWANAERWEVNVDFARCPGLSSGTRMVWVVLGRKWAYLRDAEDSTKMHVSEWERMSRNGRRVWP